MDQAANLASTAAATAGPVGILLLLAGWWLARQLGKREAQIEERARQDRADCRHDYAELAARLRTVEDRGHGEMLTLNLAQQKTADRFARAFEALVNRGQLAADDEKTTGQHASRKD